MDSYWFDWKWCELMHQLFLLNRETQTSLENSICGNIFNTYWQWARISCSQCVVENVIKLFKYSYPLWKNTSSWNSSETVCFIIYWTNSIYQDLGQLLFLYSTLLSKWTDTKCVDLSTFFKQFFCQLSVSKSCLHCKC